jgi:hypothetical protein
MTLAKGLMDDLPEHQEASEEIREVREADLASLDVLPICVYLISYRGYPRFIWANKQCLKVLDKTLEELLASVCSSLTNPSLPAAGRAPFANSGKHLSTGSLSFCPPGPGGCAPTHQRTDDVAGLSFHCDHLVPPALPPLDNG